MVHKHCYILYYYGNKKCFATAQNVGQECYGSPCIEVQQCTYLSRAISKASLLWQMQRTTEILASFLVNKISKKVILNLVTNNMAQAEILHMFYVTTNDIIARKKKKISCSI